MEHKFFWLNPSLKVKKTKQYGYGTFSSKDIKKGELLLVLSGYVLGLDVEESLPEGLNDNGIQITDNLSLCVTDKNELGGINFFNHSCEPNAGIRGQIFLVAMKKIKAGEEATFDYAMTLSESPKAGKYSLPCLCGKNKCRKVITDSDWRLPSLQEKYDGYFQFYIQEKIYKQKLARKK